MLSRKIIESEIFNKPPLYIKVWIYLLSRAQHKQHKGLKRGQQFVTIPEIIEACSWKVGFRIEKPTKDQVYQVLQWLRSGNEGGNESNRKATMITTTKATQGMVLTIENYDFYQTSDNYESNAESNNEKVMKPERKQRQPNNINKNDKNDKNDNNIIIVEIVNYLNEKAGKKFSSSTATTAKLINGRLNEGRSLEDFKKVIDRKCSDWKGKKNKEGKGMGDYLRPNTLFSPSNFENYLNECNSDSKNNDDWRDI